MHTVKTSAEATAKSLFILKTVKEQALDCQARSGNIWTEIFRNSAVDNNIL